MFYLMIWLILFIIAFIVLTVYYLIYTKKINQCVCDGNENGKKMLDFPKAVVSVTIMLLLSICVVNALVPTSATTVSRNNYAVIDTSDYSYLAYSSNFNLDDASFAKLFQKDENMEGYTRKEIKDGDFNFIIFTSSTPPDSFHPDFLCYVTYTGDSTKVTAMSHNGQFQDIHTSQKGGTSAIGDFKNQTLLIIGNWEEESLFSLTMGVYDKLGYENYEKSTAPEEAMEDFAFSVGAVLIKKD
ncbi:MAG: hypothetical protein K2N51_16515 [Lachnospiraceae bacterium]|nr:hypothetical protein [Lachnospiraceae bacterium]